MNTEFWISRWRENRIGFHTDGIQPLLEQFWEHVAPAAGGRVLVPLCGKTHDMLWLRNRGHEVVGVDVSQIAARSFASEHGLVFSESEDPPFLRFSDAGIDYLVGDFFGLTPRHVGRVHLAYDRAALIALPPERRPAYAAKIKNLLDIEFNILLINIDYDQNQMSGPPYAVSESEIRTLYAGCEVERLVLEECLDREPRFRERGLTWMTQGAYHIHTCPDASGAPDIVGSR